MRAAGAADDHAVAAALGSVGLDVREFGERRIDELSGGQQRRVALAGLLARRPAVLVLDEPLAGLDEPSQKGLLDLLAALRYEQGLTIVIISHDLEGTGRVCDRLIELDRGRIASDQVKAAVPLW
jgi:energy-coupling factor transport system ATP-binding protein